MHGAPPGPEPHRSAAWPLAWVATALVVYATLHPLSGWTWPAGPWTWALPKQAQEIPSDVIANLLGYMPLGAVWCLAWLRSGNAPLHAAWRTLLFCTCLSYLLELAQFFLPTRVSSISDWTLNTLGALWGILMALTAHAVGLVDWWHRWRERLFIPQAGFGLALLCLWPLGLLFPPPFPLGEGQLWTALHSHLLDWTAQTPWQHWLDAGPGAVAMADRPLWQAMSASEPTLALHGPSSGGPLLETVVVALGLLAPMAVACTLTRPRAVRLFLLAGAVFMAIFASTFSAALNYGPTNALTWLNQAVVVGLSLGALAGAFLLERSRTESALWGMAAIAALVWCIHRVPPDPYYAQTLLAWDHGRFVRLHGLSRWFGLLWPYVAFAWLGGRFVARRP